jgi:hypothetical protein
MTKIGEKLENLALKTQIHILLVAPFIKVAVLTQLLANIKPGVKIVCLTRWLPEDILKGVCDLEIWEVIKTFPTASLWLRSDLHAKYYRFDGNCLVGSANLTAKGLGYSSLSNLELLVQLPVSDCELQKFEQELFNGAIQVNDDYFREFQQLIIQLRQENFSLPLTTPELVIDSSVSSISLEAWLPTLRNPEELYIAYCGDWENLTTLARETAKNDLGYLSIVANLSKNTFKAYIGAMLLQKPIIQQLDVFVNTPQRFGAVSDFLASLPCKNLPNFDPKRAWQTLMRWLLYFLPHRYTLSVPRYSEIFSRVHNYDP